MRHLEQSQSVSGVEAIRSRAESPVANRAMWPSSRSSGDPTVWLMRDYALGMGAMIGIGAAIGVLFMPMFGPLALAVGAALGVVFGAVLEARRTTR